MKKRVLALLLCVSTAISMTGCGSKGESVEATEAVENTESTEEVPAVPLAQYDLKGSDYVTLCDYSAIPVTISGDYDVTDQDVLDYVEKIFTQGGPFYTADPDKTTVEEGDIVNVDYVGKLDGEAFSGGTAEDQNIDVSNNSSTSGSAYIDGFTDGLIGASVRWMMNLHRNSLVRIPWMECTSRYASIWSQAQRALIKMIFTPLWRIIC